MGKSANAACPDLKLCASCPDLSALAAEASSAPKSSLGIPDLLSPTPSSSSSDSNVVSESDPIKNSNVKPDKGTTSSKRNGGKHQKSANGKQKASKSLRGYFTSQSRRK